MTTAEPSIVVDTSVAVKWFRQEREADVDRARHLRDQHLRGLLTICGPSLMLWELGNVLKNKPDFTQDDVVTALQSVAELEIKFFEPSFPLLRRAVDIAYSADISLYDAAFVALADTLDCAFVTADERLARKAPSTKVQLLSQT